MQKMFLLCLALLAGGALWAQDGSASQVSWTYTAKKIGAGTFEVHMLAHIGGNWHIYAQNAGDGPISTSFTFTKNPLVTVSGLTREVGKMKTVYETAFKSNVHYYESTVDFVQVIKLKSSIKTNLAGKVEFMVCNDKECLPPSDVDFKIPLGS
jgi:thiol:disulfide interchange protein DsbD